MSEKEPLVEIQVMVNVDSMRRGQVGEVELSARIQSLVDRGYLRILGHVEVPFVAPEPLAQPTPPEPPARRSRPSRAKTKPSETPPEDADGDRSGYADLG